MTTYQTGDVIHDKYELTDLLGRGGMGVVYAAKNRDLGTEVALKFLQAPQGDTQEVVARFRREANLASRIKSEHVARVFDIVTTAAGESFIVMERLKGKDMAKVLRERGPLPVDEVADLLLQACEAIVEAHTLGIVHRDLKPANIFVTDPPHGRPFVKVLDFGIAKSTAPDEPAMTAGAAVVGSPRYMSPEQLNPAKDVDARSDVWSLGVTLYELLTGKPPFEGNGFREISAAVLHGDPPELSEHRRGLPVGLEELVSECLLVDRNARLASVAAFAARLAPFGSTSAHSSIERIQGLVAGASRSASAGLTSPPAIGGGDITTNERAATVVTKAPSPTPAARRWRGPAAVAALGVIAGGGVLGSHLVPSPSAASAASPTLVGSTVVALASAAPGSTASTASPSPPCAAGATPTCETACTAHEPGSCLALAAALEKGTGVPRDVSRAAQLYQSECDVGALVACNALGALYGRGDGVPLDNVKAAELYDRACKGGVARACMNLGGMNYDGTGVSRNEELATHEFLDACDDGEPLGCLNVAVAYAQGRGVKKDMEKSLSFAQRACDGGAQAGCARVTAAKVSGEGAAKDVKGGVAALDTACTHGQGAACDELRALYARGAPDVAADPLQVRVYAKRACDLGVKNDCEAQVLRKDIDRSNNAAALINGKYEAQCNAGIMTSCTMFGANLMAGHGVTADRARGRELLGRACKGGVPLACTMLADAGAP